MRLRQLLTISTLSRTCFLLCVIAFFFWPAILAAMIVLFIIERMNRQGGGLRSVWIVRLVLWIVAAPLVLSSLLTAKVTVYDILYQRLRLGSEVQARETVREIRTSLNRYVELHGSFPADLGQLVESKLLNERYTSRCAFGRTQTCLFGYALRYEPERPISGMPNSPGYSRFSLIAYPGFLSFGRRNFTLVHSGEILIRDSLEDVNGSTELPPPDWRISANGIGN